MNNKNNFVTMPGAIIIAAAIIAIAIIWVNKPAGTTPTQSVENAVQPSDQKIADVAMKPVSSADHIFGDPNAPVKIVEYSDTSCPYCKAFDPIMQQVISAYGPSGQVAWVYRYFPLDKPGTRPDGGILHVNSGHEAQAMECAASLGGNDKFWAFEKKLYETTPGVTGETPNGLDQKQLPVIAKAVGLDEKAFNTCLDSGKFKSVVEADYLDGLNAGVTGTPYSILITPSGSKIPLEGVTSFTTLRKTIDTLLSSTQDSSAPNSAAQN